MMICDYHVHTLFCDGKSSPSEVAEAAFKAGASELGFSVHSYTEFDTSYCIKKERLREYIEEISRLKEAYKDKMKILCGTELDRYSDMNTEGLDFVIGSVHYIKADGSYIPIDESAEILKKAVNSHFGGDFMLLCEAYYKEVAQLAAMPRLDIIGHIDLITKFNEGEVLFDESDKRYRKAVKAAVDALLPRKAPFEVNTGAVSRGYKSNPYPARFIIEYIAERGGSVILSSDSHSCGGLFYGFDSARELTASLGVNVLEKLR